MCRALWIILQHWSDIVMATGGDGPADDHSGINFGVELDIPWNAPEAYVDLNSGGIYDLATVPDAISLRARRPGAPVVKVLLGRDSRSVRALVPDPDVHYRVSMMSRLWIWGTRQGRLCLSPSYLCFGCSGRCRSCPVCHGTSRTWNVCGQ